MLRSNASSLNGASRTGKMAAPLQIGVILPDTANVEAGTAWLLNRLCIDSRFALAALIEEPSTSALVPAGVRHVLMFEELTVARPRSVSAPAFEKNRKNIPVYRIGEAPNLPSLDVLIDLSHAATAEALSGATRHGVWRLSCGDFNAGLVDPMIGAASSSVTLRSCPSPGAGWKVLATASYDVKFLAARNRNFQREKAPQLIEQALARLALGLDPSQPEVQVPDKAPLPTTRLLPAYAAQVAGQVSRRLKNKLIERIGGRPRRFCIRLCHGGLLDFTLDGGIEFDAPPGRYWADPFIFEYAGSTYLFLEEFVYRSGLGHIVVCLVKGDQLIELGPALKTGTHLSYPFVFQRGEEIFMIPETNASRRLEVWRAKAFPLEWELHATALDGMTCADTTVLQEENGLWIFTNICRDSYSDFSSELHIYHAESPDLCRMRPHALNPVVIGSRCARGAGRIIRQNGKLYRPSQDNSHGIYGYGLNIMEISELSLESYHETRVRHVTTDHDPDLIGCHHIDVFGDKVVLDVRRP